MRFYYFAISCFESITTWVANCRRPRSYLDLINDIIGVKILLDLNETYNILVIDEDPIDGGWSEWSPWGCNVRCGGGFGFRERKCNNPRPNYKGKPCFGVARQGGECNKFECGCVNPSRSLTLTMNNLSKISIFKNFLIIINMFRPF